MKYRYNPFTPNSPVFKGMFVGREREIQRIDEILFQTKNANPTNILLTGERGIGKSSLLLVTNYFSKGDLHLSEDIYNFFTIQISLTNEMKLFEFIIKLKNAFERELSKLNKKIETIKKVWEFIQRIEIAGTGLKGKNNALTEVEIMDKLTFSIIDTIKLLTSKNVISDLGFKKKDGIVILIDEADKASNELNLGSFIKNLSEKLILENCNKFLLVLAGLPSICKILRESHESSLRLFEEFNQAGTPRL
jgi:AAA+ ATPase superfamily predicted ATPase